MNPADRLLQRWRFRAAASHVPVGSRILDIGAHDGEFLEYLGDRIASSVGVDSGISNDARIGRHLVLVGRFPGTVVEGSFDAATLLAVVEHLDDDALAPFAVGLLGALRPGGTVVVTMPVPAADGVLRMLRDARIIEGMDLEAHHRSSVDAVIGSFCDAGFVLRTRRRFELGFNNLLVFTAPGGPSRGGRK